MMNDFYDRYWEQKRKSKNNYGKKIKLGVYLKKVKSIQFRVGRCRKQCYTLKYKCSSENSTIKMCLDILNRWPNGP